MKAWLPINSGLKKRVWQEVEKEYEKQGNDATRRIFKLFCIALNETNGFGKQRLDRLIGEVENLSRESKQDEVFWAHVDKRLKDIGVMFDDEDWRKGFS